MAAPQKFRTAINGFNRADVVSYIEYINNRHETAMNQLQEELERVRGVISWLQDSESEPADDGALAELTEKCARLEADNAALTEKLSARMQEVGQLQAQLAQMTAERDAALATQLAAQRQTDLELEAYRRAERTERLAQARASRMFDLANGALADTAAELDTAAASLGQLAEAAMVRVQELQNAVSGSKQVLSDAAASLRGIPAQEDVD